VSGLLALIVGGAFTTMLVATSRERHSTELAQHSQQVLAAANRLEQLVLSLEASQRGFSLTRDRVALRRWQSARRAVPAANAQLVALTVVPAHQAAARRFVSATGSYIRNYSAPRLDRARRSAAAARRAVPSDAMRHAEADLSGQFGRFTATQQHFVADRQRRAHAAAVSARSVGIVGLAASLVLIALFGGYLTRVVVIPVRRAASMARRLAAGDLSARVPETGPGEIGALERAFNTMSASLESSSGELRQLAEEQAALRRIATLVARGVPSADLLTAVVEEVDRVLGATSTRLAQYTEGSVTVVISSGADDEIPVGASWPLDGDHIAGKVYRTGRTARRDTSEGVSGYLGSELRKMGVRSAIGAPIMVDGRLWGTMVPYWTDDYPPPDVEQRLAQFTDLIATAIANTASREALTASRARVVASADEARRRIERDLHDGAQQRLLHTVITLKLAQRKLGGADAAAASLVDEALEQAESATAELRELVHGILPASLDRGGLRAGVNTLVARAPLPVSVAVTDERLPPRVEATGYFIVAEALANVIKHAAATCAEVRAELDDGVLRIEVHDDGRGGAHLDGSSGLIGLSDRAAALDGELEVESPAGGGTVVTATLPVPHR
jgi:signal transduction histidine kinase